MNLPQLSTLIILCWLAPAVHSQVAIWSKHEISFTSDKNYANPLYEVKEFYATFTSPTGRKHIRNGFWDGDRAFKIRFMPTEVGKWSYSTICSDDQNSGLHGLKGNFTCTVNNSSEKIYQLGALERIPGNYYLTYADGSPFFYVACTAWNGALKSTDSEWEKYLSQRKENNYNVIQFVTTQWRGCEKDQLGETAFTGSGKIEINPDFFKRIDNKIEAINAKGLIAAPVLLWALPRGAGREFSPGYYLPEDEAILLARYMVARFGGDQVIWILGGDGSYVNDYEQRWKRIGREVFDGHHPGVVAQHPHGSSWIGEDYKEEDWLDIIGYQSSHNNSERVVNWINKGPMASQWDKLPPRPLINLEPNYEEIRFFITAEDVRNASYWSLLATPLAGITYGANGIWPWIQKEGELIENHGNPGGRGPSTWETSMNFPGSLQIGYLSKFIQQYPWWSLKPSQKLLLEQPGDSVYNHFISVVADDGQSLIIAYTPRRQAIVLALDKNKAYDAKWFDPIKDKYSPAEAEIGDHHYSFHPPGAQDYLLILTAK